MSAEEKLNLLSARLSADSFEVIADYTRSRSIIGRNLVTNILDTYIGLLEAPLRHDDSAEITKVLSFIRSHLCQIHTQETATQKLSVLSKITSQLTEKGLISGDFVFPEKPNSAVRHEAYKNQKIPTEYLSKIKQKIKAKEELDNTLSNTCSPEIVQRLKEHVYSFKNVKQHRAPLVVFLKQASDSHPNWYKNPNVIQGELLKYRNSLLGKAHRSTAYGRFQNVKNAIKVLIDHKLLPKETDLPDNLRRCTNSQKIRKDNPLLCSTNIYDDRKKDLFRSSLEFIKTIKEEISKNLNTILSEAKKIVHEAFHKFEHKERLISNSDRLEFLKHPDLRIDGINSRTKKTIEINPFYSANPKSLENKIAYFDHFYEYFIQGKPGHNIYDIRCTEAISEYLGLTPYTASAMQIIIVEELGINPYPLYNAKVHSDGRGHEFVQVTDNGSVRLKTLKPRARNARTRNAPGSLKDLTDTKEQDINASTCLKMALEMTKRARDFTGKKELWLCECKDGLTNPVPETFQNSFNKIRIKAASKSEALNSATLKKIRSSKGVLVYLNSNGDSLRTASYFGNSVKTTLARYIPSYLTELVYRVKIRSFQNILLFMAVAQDKSPADSLGISNNYYKEQLEKAFNNPDMGGSFYENLKAKNPEHDATKVKYFCVSLKNIILALKYAKDGEDKNLKDDCITAISKIAEGPVIMKQLLRQAQKQLSHDQGVENG